MKRTPKPNKTLSKVEIQDNIASLKDGTEWTAELLDGLPEKRVVEIAQSIGLDADIRDSKAETIKDILTILEKTDIGAQTSVESACRCDRCKIRIEGGLLEKGATCPGCRVQSTFSSIDI